MISETMSAMSTKSPLGKLINSARAPEKLSLQAIADRASGHGFDMSKQNVSRLANDYPLASISGAHIRGLALALGVSERRVAAAALGALGLELADESTPLRQAILDEDRIGERTKRTLLTIIENAMHDDEMDLEHQARQLGQGDVELAARNRDVHGQPIRSRGRQIRREHDEAATGSQDPGGMDPS